MSSSYVVQLVQMLHTGQMMEKELVVQVPKRVVRIYSPESLKQYVAEQLGVPVDTVTSITPFYK